MIQNLGEAVFIVVAVIVDIIVRFFRSHLRKLQLAHPNIPELPG